VGNKSLEGRRKSKEIKGPRTKKGSNSKEREKKSDEESYSLLNKVMKHQP
jgi:hypothetical protein